jgi:hypothetical protein
MDTLNEKTPPTEEQPREQGGIALGSRAQEAPSPRTINTDPREWSAMPPPSMMPYRAPVYPVGPLPQQRRGRGPWLAITLIVVILVLLIGGIGWLIASIVGGIVSHTSSETRNFAVNTHPQIVVINDTGSIHVNVGSASNEVTVQATRWIGGFGNVTDDIQVRYDQNSEGNTLTVTVERMNPSNIPDFNHADIDLTVPATADLHLTSNTGEIWSTGVSGQMTLISNTGSITVRQGTLGGDSRLTTNTGSVTFQGAIDPHGSYVFSANTGSVQVTLPHNAAFHVEASTDTGSIMSDFSGVLVTKLNYTRSEAHGDVGTPPRAMLTLTTNTGSISLSEGA